MTVTIELVMIKACRMNYEMNKNCRLCSSVRNFTICNGSSSRDYDHVREDDRNRK